MARRTWSWGEDRVQRRRERIERAATTSIPRQLLITALQLAAIAAVITLLVELVA